MLGTSTSCVTVIVQTGANFGRVSLDRETAGHHFLWLAKETMQPCNRCIVRPKDKSDKIKQNRFSLQRIKALHIRHPLSLWNITSDGAGDWPQKEPQSHAPTTKVPG